MNNLINLFNQAFQHHQSGNVPAAINLYLQILPMQRENDELLFTIGTAYCQIGQLEEGLNYLRKSSRINPKNFHTFGNMGRLLTDLRRFDEAILNYNRAILLNPNFPEALLGRGNALVEIKKYEEALQDYTKVLKLVPEFAIAHLNKGKVLFELHKFDESLNCYNRAIALAPNLAEAYSNRGNVLKELKQHEQALLDYNKAIEINPNLEGTYTNRGCVLEELERYNEALADHDKAILLKPDYAEAYNNRGIVLKELARHDEALACYGKAIALKPDYAEAYSNRGTVLQELKRYDEALSYYDKAIALKPDYAKAYSSRGTVLQELTRYDEALSYYDKAIALKPDYAEATWNKSLLLILTGQYSEGWKLYESRFETKEQKRNYYKFPKLAWRGQNEIQTKKLLIYSEQGFGDTIMFCRYLRQARNNCEEIIFEAPSELISLVSTLDCNMTLVAKGDKLPAFDAYCPLMSLPYVFKTTVETIPAISPYLFADQSKVSQWVNRLGRKRTLRIGLAWSGSTTHKNDKNRSMKLEHLKPLANLPVELHSLQKDYRDQDLDQLANLGIYNHQNDINDFSDTAALAQCMDLVISVDTSIAHLACSIGKTVWILLPNASEYRWMADRADSPWYPTARLLRQPKLDDWNSVIDSVYSDLYAMTNKICTEPK